MNQMNPVISGEEASLLALLAQCMISSDHSIEEVNELMADINAKSDHVKKIARLILHPDWSDPLDSTADAIIHWALSQRKPAIT